jgi:cytochrome c-type biogenesis protein CcmH
MAPCCYTQTIRDHDSQVAVDMRNEVTAFVASGKSEQEIITYYRTKYGETILVVPDGNTVRIAYGIPVAASLAAVGLLFFAIRRSVKAGEVATGQIVTKELSVEMQNYRNTIRSDLGGDL